ncbi:unnamed protein product [Lymnaea stagnalis]|uniref:Uncharacterized protein n=1 Tax=Lymnaea stagnalis TaxID=6523 RepID=A0AAV2ICX5_LYMST
MDIGIFIYLLFLSRLVIINCGSVTVTPFCPPAEEGKEYTMTFRWTPPKERILNIEIIREETAVASCSSLNVCNDYIPSLIRTTSTLNKTSSEITIFVQIFSMIRKKREHTHTDWYVSLQARDLTSCRVNFYTKVTMINCVQFLDVNHLFVTCKTSPTYHEVKWKIVNITRGVGVLF